MRRVRAVPPRCAAILLLLAFAAGCVREEPRSPLRSQDTPTQITRDFQTTESDSAGRVRYVLWARIARTYRGDITRAEEIRVDFYDDGRKVSVLTARQGLLEGGRLSASGNVVVETVEGTRLETESLYWDTGQQKIRSDDFVRVTHRGDPEVLTGQGLTSDPDLEFIDFGRTHVSGPAENP